MLRSLGRELTTVALVAGACVGLTGCITSSAREVAEIRHSAVPREKEMVSLPTYRVAPPDILLIEALNNIRLSRDRLRAGDSLQIELGNPAPLDISPPGDLEAPPTQAETLEAQFRLQKQVEDKFLDRQFLIHPDGRVHLGPIYGSVKVAGMTLDEAKHAIREHLKSYTTDAEGNPVGLQDPQVTVSLPDVTGRQQIAGEPLVRPDGTISLGIYGSVYVAGMTLQEVKAAVEEHLSQHIHEPQVNVDVLAYNSKVIYVIRDGAGFGQEIVRLPVTGNETVLDAIAQIQGLSEVSGKRIWVARPGPPGQDYAQVMDVHWSAIVKEGITTTNYQLMPGDRIYVQGDHLTHIDNFIAKVTAPAERIMGFILLGHGVQRTLQFGHLRGGQGGIGGFGGGFGGVGGF